MVKHGVYRTITAWAFCRAFARVRCGRGEGVFLRVRPTKDKDEKQILFGDDKLK
jgi:hypothetical protein